MLKRKSATFGLSTNIFQKNENFPVALTPDPAFIKASLGEGQTGFIVLGRWGSSRKPAFSSVGELYLSQSCSRVAGSIPAVGEYWGIHGAKNGQVAVNASQL